MKTTEFITLYKPCLNGKEFAEKFKTMSEVWEACKRPDWLFWILEKHKPLEKEQSVKLAIAFAETSFSNWNNENDLRPKQAIEAAKVWLENPCEKTRSAAESAAESAWSAAWSARSAARSAAWSARSAARSAAWSARSARSAARSAAWSAAESAARSAAESAAWSAAWSAAESAARSAAESAAWSAARSAAWSAAWSAQCEQIRNLIPNPFK